MISLGTSDEALSMNDTIINYTEASDCPIPHIQQVKKYFFLFMQTEH